MSTWRCNNTNVALSVGPSLHCTYQCRMANSTVRHAHFLSMYKNIPDKDAAILHWPPFRTWLVHTGPKFTQSFGWFWEKRPLNGICVTEIKYDWLLLSWLCEKLWKSEPWHGYYKTSIVCQHRADLIWVYVAGVLVTNTGSLIWAGMLIPALYICRQIINISPVAWPAHVVLQLWTAVPFIIIMPRWSNGVWGWRRLREKLIFSKLSG